MANQNFRVKTGLEVGTGVTISAGIVTAVSFRGDGSALTGIAATTNVRTNSLVVSGVSTLGNTVVGGGTTQLIVNGDARITGILTIGTSSITLDGNNNQIQIGAGVTLNSSGSAVFSNGINVSGVSTLSTLQVGTGGTTITTTIGGLVGIGTTDPTKLLTVSGDVLINGLTFGQGPSVYSSNAGNVVLGTNAFTSNASGSGNIAIGYSALTRHQSGNNNTAVGNYALNGDISSAETGYDNTAVGSLTLYSNRFGYQNTAIGKESLYTNTDGLNNVALGYQSLYSNTGSYNSAVGNQALYSNTNGTNNTAVGNLALYSNNDGLYNTAVGDSALLSNSSGSDNAAIGYQALNASNGNYNIAAGNYALRNNTSGSSNTGVGVYALDNNTTGGSNVGVGYKSLSGNSSGTHNVAIGWNAGVNLSGAGRYNVLIGPCGSTIFTPTAAPPIPGGSNQLVIGAGNTAWIYGNSSYNVGVGTTNPTSKLHIVGNTLVSGIITATTVNDSIGNVRAVPQNAQTSAYILAASDVGKHISITTGGVTVNASVFSAGDAVTIYNNSSSNQTITQGASVTLRQAGTANTGNRTLAQYGVCTILCIVGGATPTFVISGAGLS